jgi:putative ABC transport system permease protein
MIWSLGWKNVWRNKIRSMVVVIAVMLGIFGGVMSIGYMQGLMQQRIYSSIHNEISHVQIHNPDFINNEEISLTINNYDKVINTLDTVSSIVAYAERTKIIAMAQSDWGATGLVIKGVDPEKEKQISELHEQLIEGKYFEKDYKMPSILIGSKAAENLKLKNWQITKEKADSLNPEDYPQEVIDKLAALPSKRYRKQKDFTKALADTLSKKEMRIYGDQLVDYFSFFRLRARVRVTVVDKQGRIETPVFRVRGIYKTTNSTFDGLTAFVKRDVLNEFANLNANEIHEIALLSTDDATGHEVGKRLETYLPENSVMSWKKISPELAMFADFGKIFNYIYVCIILFALAFGIINTMLMSVLERLKELGMLMAIGMNKKKVFRMIMLESVFLTLTGAIVGMGFSGVILKILSKTGINFSGLAEGYEAIGYSAIVYPVVSWDNFLGITILVTITGIISSIWPARKALKLNPCEALRTE